MRWPRIIASVTVILVVSSSGCSLFAPDPLPFAWMEPGTRFVYNFQNAGEPYVDPVFGFEYADADTAFVLRIDGPEYVELRFMVEYPAWGFHHIDGGSVPNVAGLRQLHPPPERARHGIALRYPVRCGGGGPFDLLVQYESAVWIPAHPSVGDVYSRYSCTDRVKESQTVAATGENVSVPAGTFETFVLYNDGMTYGKGGPEKHYWSESHGLIKMELFNKDGSLLGTYELISKNF
jgi:hypothetical protein